MIFKTTEAQSFDAEVLRQELVAAFGTSSDWYIKTGSGEVEFCGEGLDPVEIITAHFNAGNARAAAAEIEKQNGYAKAALIEIDIKSIRSIREYIAAKPDVPAVLSECEAEAITTRGKIKP